MKTTNLFIELLVIGVGAAICLIMILKLLIGLDFLESVPMNSSVLLFPITAITYVLGIIFDRLFDLITDKWDKTIRSQHLTDEQYKDVRTILYNDSKMVQEVFDYTKNRIRIVRSWMFYFMIMAILILLDAIIFDKINSFAFSFLLILLSLFSAIAFRKLNHSFYGLLNSATIVKS